MIAPKMAMPATSRKAKRWRCMFQSLSRVGGKGGQRQAQADLDTAGHVIADGDAGAWAIQRGQAFAQIAEADATTRARFGAGVKAAAAVGDLDAQAVVVLPHGQGDFAAFDLGFQTMLDGI